MVGDSPDVLASKHASTLFPLELSISMYHRRKILEQTEPDLLIEHVSDLPKYTLQRKAQAFLMPELLS